MPSNVEKAFGRLNALVCRQREIGVMMDMLNEQGESRLVLKHINSDRQMVFEAGSNERLLGLLEDESARLSKEARSAAYELIGALEKAHDLGQTKFEKACEALTMTINATGGLVDNGGLLAPKGDDEWYDLADAYILACEAMGCEPMVAKEDE